MKTTTTFILTIALAATAAGGTGCISASASSAECQVPTDNCNPAWGQPDGGTTVNESDLGVEEEKYESPALEHKPVRSPRPSKARDGRLSDEEGKQRVACPLDVSKKFKAREYNTLSRPEQLSCVEGRRNHLKEWRHAKRSATKRPAIEEEETPEEPEATKFAFGEDDVYAAKRAATIAFRGLKLAAPPLPMLQMPVMSKGQEPQMVATMGTVPIGSSSPEKTIEFRFPRLVTRAPIDVILKREPSEPIVPFAMQTNLRPGYEILDRGMGGDKPAPTKAETDGVPLEMYGVFHVPLTAEQRAKAVKDGEREFARLERVRQAQIKVWRKLGYIPAEEKPPESDPSLEELRDRATDNIARILAALDETKLGKGMIARNPAPADDPRLMALLREANHDLEVISQLITARDKASAPMAQK